MSNGYCDLPGEIVSWLRDVNFPFFDSLIIMEIEFTTKNLALTQMHFSLADPFFRMLPVSETIYILLYNLLAYFCLTGARSETPRVKNGECNFHRRKLRVLKKSSTTENCTFVKKHITCVTYMLMFWFHVSFRTSILACTKS